MSFINISKTCEASGIVAQIIEYRIKFVHPDWYLDALKEQRVGFPKREQHTRFIKGAKLYIYLTTAQKEHMYSPIVKEYQRRLVGIYTVLGDFRDGEHFPDKKPGYPLNIPVKIEFSKVIREKGCLWNPFKKPFHGFYLDTVRVIKLLQKMYICFFVTVLLMVIKCYM